ANILESTPVAVLADQARVRLNDAIELTVNTTSIPPDSKNALISSGRRRFTCRKPIPAEKMFSRRG
ncbi:MAG: hypothetical protein M3Q86_04405, partial [Verrucomicrobiota bacterium]|nr:hypothetical protein [Verrucomicrobiota bacterium]